MLAHAPDAASPPAAPELPSNTARRQVADDLRVALAAVARGPTSRRPGGGIDPTDFLAILARAHVRAWIAPSAPAVRTAPTLELRHRPA